MRKVKRRRRAKAKGRIQMPDGTLVCTTCGFVIKDDDPVEWVQGEYLRHEVCHMRVKAGRATDA